MNEEVARSSFKNAGKYIGVGNWVHAFAHYLVFLELRPASRVLHENDLANVLFHLGEYLERNNLVEDLIKSYLKALRYYPRNIQIYNELGARLLRLCEPEAAYEYLKLGSSIDSSFLSLEKNLQTAKLSLIPRWHFRMLNDRYRNAAYFKAIRNVITHEYSKVLDIGTGSGLLSYYALQCKETESIISLESSETLSKIARKALRYNKKVKVINKNSSELQTGDVDFSNVLVTEIFDAGLVGEHALGTLIHAWENLLEPSAKVIPRSSDLFVTGISCNEILNKIRVFHEIPQLNLRNMCVKRITCDKEPYEADNLKEKNVKYMTNTQRVVNIDFSNVQQLKCIYEDVRGISPFILKCSTSGSIDAFVVWFDLHLDENVMITTNPQMDNVKCWEQAVIYLDHRLRVQEGDEIQLQLSCVGNKLKIDVINDTSTCPRCFKISPEMITFLNDTQILEVAEKLVLPQQYHKVGFQALDLNPVPFFALFCAKQGILGNYKCVAGCDSDHEFLEHLWQINGFTSGEDANSGAKVTFEICRWPNIRENFQEQSLDVVFINPISQNGTLHEDIFTELPNIFAALKTDGVLLPNEIRLNVELIESEYLDFCSLVDDENLLGFKVANKINKFAILEQWQVQPQKYQRRTLCDVVTTSDLLKNVLSPCSWCHDVIIRQDGTANGVLYWYQLEYLDNVAINTYTSTHYNGACFKLKFPLSVQTGETVKIILEQNLGLLKIGCDEQLENDYELQKLEYGVTVDHHERNYAQNGSCKNISNREQRPLSTKSNIIMTARSYNIMNTVIEGNQKGSHFSKYNLFQNPVYLTTSNILMAIYHINL